MGRMTRRTVRQKKRRNTEAVVAKVEAVEIRYGDVAGILAALRAINPETKDVEARIRLSRKAQKIHLALTPIREKIEEEERKLFDEHVEKDADGDPVKNEEGVYRFRNRVAHQRDMAKLASLTETVTIPRLTREDFVKAKVKDSPELSILLGPVLEADEDEEQDE